MTDITMFADYRVRSFSQILLEAEKLQVPQILHHLNILKYPSSLVSALKSSVVLASGSREEVSIRSASILAVEAIRVEVVKLQQKTEDANSARYQ